MSSQASMQIVDKFTGISCCATMSTLSRSDNDYWQKFSNTTTTTTTTNNNNNNNNRLYYNNNRC